MLEIIVYRGIERVEDVRALFVSPIDPASVSRGTIPDRVERKANNQTCTSSSDNSLSNSLSVSCLAGPPKHSCPSKLTHVHIPPAPSRRPYPPREARFVHAAQLAEARPCPVGIPDKVDGGDAIGEDVDH